MLFSGHRGQELAEIKALYDDLRGRVEESQEQLQDISRGLGLAPRGENGNGAEPLIAFVHIPKTAGGTVSSMFAAAYSRAALHKAGNYFRSPDKTLEKLARSPEDWASWRQRGERVTVGHVPYGVFREHVPADTRYMTFLREPVDRVLSQYYRHIHRRKPRKAKEPTGAEANKADSLEEAIVDFGLPQVNNLATRFLCGDPSPVGRLPASALDEAKANLSQFAFVGIQERFEESVVLLQRLLGLYLVPREAYEDMHVSSDRPSVDEIPGEERALIEDYNSLDLELYAFAREMFEDTLATAADEQFAADVDTLRG